jgi:hypothetical protein
MLELFPVLALSSAIAGAMPAAAPLKLIVNRDGARSVVRVVGESAVPCTATYRLEVTSGSAGTAQLPRAMPHLEQA